jgi:hypothetical protein
MPTIRYPEYIVRYLKDHHGYTFPEDIRESQELVHDHLFTLALEANRMRERALPMAVASLEQEIGWIKASLSHAAGKGNKPHAVYEPLGDTVTSNALQRAVKELNRREHDINELCRALEETYAQ